MAKGKADLYQAKESFVTMVGDDQVSVSKGDLVRSGHPLLKGRDELFQPAEGYVRFDVEEATAAPGRKRGDEETPDEEPEEKPTETTTAAKKRGG